jgi:hypothetical protein
VAATHPRQREQRDQQGTLGVASDGHGEPPGAGQLFIYRLLLVKSCLIFA